jgi:hypothetical protein
MEEEMTCVIGRGDPLDMSRHQRITDRPPLGLRPKHIADACRAREVLEAIDRYMAAGKPVPAEWVDELKALICE